VLRATTPPPSVEFFAPEQLFDITDIRVEGVSSTGSMPVGRRLTGGDGRLAMGALGVFIDDLLGFAIVTTRPEGHSAVSTEISLEVLPSLQAPTERLRVEASNVHVDGMSAFATARVVNDEGDLVAVCSQRGRYVPSRTATSTELQVTAPVQDAQGFAELIGARTRREADGAHVELTAESHLLNRLGIMHGGFAIGASDLAAAAALEIAEKPALSTAAVHIAYLRPIASGSRVDFHATVRHRGRSFGMVDVVGTVDGRPCTIAQITAHAAA